MEHGLGAGSSLIIEGWCGEYTSPDGLITLSINDSEEDFHIDARPGHSASSMRAVLGVARSWGVEPLSEDEFEPELLEDGSVRIYLALIEQPVAKASPPRSIVKRTAGKFALAAAIAGAALLPSPLHHNYPSTVPSLFTADDDGEGHSIHTSVPTINKQYPEGGLPIGPENSRPAAAEAPAPEPVRAARRMGPPPGRPGERRQADRAHSHHNVHRLHRGQVQPDRLAESDGFDWFGKSPRPAGKVAVPGPRRPV